MSEKGIFFSLLHDFSKYCCIFAACFSELRGHKTYLLNIPVELVPRKGLYERNYTLLKMRLA